MILTPSSESDSEWAAAARRVRSWPHLLSRRGDPGGQPARVSEVRGDGDTSGPGGFTGSWSGTVANARCDGGNRGPKRGWAPGGQISGTGPKWGLKEPATGSARECWPKRGSRMSVARGGQRSGKNRVPQATDFY